MKTQKLSQTDLASLLLKAQAGDARSAELLLKIHTPLVLAVVQPFRRQRRVAADDLLAEAFTGALHAISAYDATKGAALPTLIHKYARTAVIHAIRTEAKSQALKNRLNTVEIPFDAIDSAADMEDGNHNTPNDTVADPNGIDIEVELERHENRELMRKLLNAALGNGRRKGTHLKQRPALETLKLLYVKGLSESEVAKRRGVSREAVRRTKDAAILRLKAYLDQNQITDINATSIPEPSAKAQPWKRGQRYR